MKSTIVWLKRLYWLLESYIAEAYVTLLPSRKYAYRSPFNEPIVISLTSFYPRFDTLHLTLKSLLTQSLKTDVVVLWLTEEDYERLPKRVLSLESKHECFEINKYQNIRSYKKLIPSLKRYPNAYVVTADDDIFYPRHWLFELVNGAQNTDGIVAHRVHKVKAEHGDFLPYAQWTMNAKENDGLLFGTSGAGMLFPPNCFSEEVFNQDVFMNECGTADDVWIFFMLSLNAYQTVWSGYSFNLITWRNTDDSGLAATNYLGSGNDQCISQLKKRYGQPMLDKNATDYTA